MILLNTLSCQYEKTLEDFYKFLLKVRGPWEVVKITRKDETEEVTVEVDIKNNHVFQCPVCGGEAKRHDFRIRRWRHLDSCEYYTWIEAKVPNCPEHGVKPEGTSKIVFRGALGCMDAPAFSG